jgi:hypothetical protein
MEHLLDIIWEYIYAAILGFAGMVNSLLSPIHTLAGPAFVLILLAFITVLFTKFLSKKCRTKRHIMLEEDFNHWLGVREEAMRCEDREKGSRMARNIDQAKLNRAYYDYFLEGLLLGFATMYLPILMVMSYVNTFYRPERLMELIGRGYIFQFGSSGGQPQPIGSIFFYFVALLSFYLGWAILKKTLEHYRLKKIIREVTTQQIVTAR